MRSRSAGLALLVAVLIVLLLFVMRLDTGLVHARCISWSGRRSGSTLFESGVHATIAGVVSWACSDAGPPAGERERGLSLTCCSRSFSDGDPVSVPAGPAGCLLRGPRASVGGRPAGRTSSILGRVSSLSFPSSRLANAGVELSVRVAGRMAVRSPVTIGIVLGLVVGKLVGVTVVLVAGCATRACVNCRGEATWTQSARHRRGGRHRLHRVAVHHQSGLRTAN